MVPQDANDPTASGPNFASIPEAASEPGISGGTIGDSDDSGAVPNVFEAPPTVPADQLAPGVDAAIPAPPGRAAPGTPVGTMVNAGVPQPAGSPFNPPAPAATAATAEAPDPSAIQSLAAELMPTLRDGIADTLNVAAETVQAGAVYFAPMIARQVLLESSGDPATAARAKNNRRHLWGQVLMTAAANGIPLQQRHEQRVMGILTTVLNVGLALALRGATGGIA